MVESGWILSGLCRCQMLFAADAREHRETKHKISLALIQLRPLASRIRLLHSRLSILLG